MLSIVNPEQVGDAGGRFGVPPRPAAAIRNIHGPSLVVVPDKVDAVLGACREASRKGGPKLLWTLAFLLLIAV
jgi:hypothetical protein